MKKKKTGLLGLDVYLNDGQLVHKAEYQEESILKPVTMTADLLRKAFKTLKNKAYFPDYLGQEINKDFFIAYYGQKFGNEMWEKYQGINFNIKK